MHARLSPLFAGLLLIGLLAATPAEAYNWMIRHGYASCASCHADPSGGGLLTLYGRAQSELLVQMPYGATSEGEVSPSSGFLFGAAELPEWLSASLAVRGGGMITRSGTTTNPVRPLLMVTDLRAAATFESVRAGASLGVAVRQAERAALTSPFDEDLNNQPYLTSREHWIGYSSEDQSFLFRAGRVQMPFGLRNIEHTAWVREATETDINQDQQHGVAVAFNGETLRGELMAIVGNFQVKPDIYRDRGYSLFVEKAFAERLAIGASSRVVFTDRDLSIRERAIRQSHGLFARWAPIHALALMAEANTVVAGIGTEDTTIGYVGWLQADFQIVQGLHILGSLETLNNRREGEGSNVGGWLSAAWFFAPHSGLRLDAVFRRQGIGESPINVTTLLAQLHTYL